ncbi:MAG: GNAT family N-acetyltransferase [Flavobacteriales bacterium]|jgi:ribosomal protein S18 acetylase RimI-like enzyme
MISIRPATRAEIPVISQLAWRIWPVVYPSIVPMEQITYMLGWMYSAESLLQQMDEGCTFLLAFSDQEPVGFASWSRLESGEGRLHKLYVLPDRHGSGIGKSLLGEVVSSCQAAGCQHLELNVNKRNPAVDFYIRNGFQHLRSEVIDIGQGYVMDDYVMAMKITP